MGRCGEGCFKNGEMQPDEGGGFCAERVFVHSSALSLITTIGLYAQEIVGFVGQHLEGSMGLLEILPVHRGKGYGTELESYLIAHMLQKGLIPFCQIESDNYKSLNLQKKLGLRISDEHIYWLF